MTARNATRSSEEESAGMMHVRAFMHLRVALQHGLQALPATATSHALLAGHIRCTTSAFGTDDCR